MTDNIFRSHEVNIGGVICGGDAPIRLQSMTTTDTANIEETVEQSVRLVQAGCDYVRITVVTLFHVECIKKIKSCLKKKGIKVPIIADVHFSRKVALAVAPFVEKVRVNPGNFTDTRLIKEETYNEDQYKEAFNKMATLFRPLIEICRQHQTAMRIGVNHGSLSGRIMYKYGDTPLGMVVSGLEFLDICEAENFDQVILSMKASCPRIMVEVNRLLVKKMKEREKFYPIHLGVTEAGDEEAGRLKSSIGIGTLLSEGIGDTVRVSLTEAPEKEVPVARKIVKRCAIGRGGEQNSRKEPCLAWLKKSLEEQVITQELKPNLMGKPYPIVIEKIKLSDKEEQGYQKKDVIWDESNKQWKWKLDQEEVKKVNVVEDLDLKSKKGSFIYSWKESQEKSFLEKYEKCTENQNCQGVWITKVGLKGLTKIQTILLEKKYEKKLLKPIYISSPTLLNLCSDIEKKSEEATEWGCFFHLLMIEKLISGVVCETDQEKKMTLSIFQAARLRTTVTEYISCPSCGRTLFDLETATAHIKKATAHLPGIKIAVMGCIVNGPGEMSDADYGYVGAARGKVTLYKGKFVIKKNVDSKDAVEELIKLIKEDGHWKEP